jgi:hypothetical protein
MKLSRQPQRSSPRTASAAVLCATLVGLGAGCAFSVSAAGGASLDGSGNAGGVGRLEARLAGGNRAFRGYVALASGGGSLGQERRGYGLVSTEVGLATGKRLRLSGGLLYGARIFEREGHGTDALHGVGGALSLHIRLKKLGAESSALYIGPRLQLERLQNRDRLVPDRTLLSLLVTLRWVTFDTTGGSYFR